MLEDESGRLSLAGDRLAATTLVTGAPPGAATGRATDAFSLTPVADAGAGRGTGRAGVIAAILGEQQVGGEFLVADVAFAGMPVQPLRPPPPAGDDLYVALVSGVQLGNKHVASPLPARLLVDWLSGELGSAQVRRATCNLWGSNDGL